MEQTSQPVLGDVFAPVDVLTVPARLDLTALLTVPGRSLAILPAELASRTLPVAPEVLSAVGEAIASGIGAPAISVMREHRLDAVVPVLRGCDNDAVARFLPARLRGILERHIGASSIVGLTVGDVAECSGIGPHGVGTVITAAVTAGLDVLVAGATTPASTSPSLDDVAIVLAHDASRSGTIHRLLAEAAASGPPYVRQAAERMLTMAGSVKDRRVDSLERALAVAGHVRDRAAFEHTVLVPRPARNRSDIAAGLGIGLERLRQLRIRATERIDEAAKHCPGEVHDLAMTVNLLVGSAAPCAAVDEVMAEHGMPTLRDPRSRLLLRMAGPYHDVDGHPGWVAVDPAELVAETRRAIHEDGGVRLAEHVAKELVSLGMGSDHVAAWLARQPVRLVDDLVVATTGTCGDIVERALHARGQEMTIDELADWIPGGQASIEVLWSARDRRFVVTHDDALALAEWDDASADGLTDREPPAGTLRVAVDDGVLAGVPGPVPAALAHTLGLRRGGRRTFSTRYGPVAVAHDGDVPTRGSIRPIALAVGASVGDELVIVLYPDGREATVSVVPRTGRNGPHSPVPQEYISDRPQPGNSPRDPRA